MDYSDISVLESATTTSNIATGLLGIVMPIMAIGILILVVLPMWKIFTKAGKPGWYAIIPIYNLYVLLQVVKKPGWWLILLVTPLVQYVVQIILAVEIGKAFGKSAWFSTFFLLLFPIGYLIIAFDKSKYVYGPSQESIPTPNDKSIKPLATSPSVDQV